MNLIEYLFAVAVSVGFSYLIYKIHERIEALNESKRLLDQKVMSMLGNVHRLEGQMLGLKRDNIDLKERIDVLEQALALNEFDNPDISPAAKHYAKKQLEKNLKDSGSSKTAERLKKNLESERSKNVGNVKTGS